MRSRVHAAVERALDARAREATEDVENILAAALGVIEESAPRAPRVTDIVAAAGVSNAAFYRYFSGRDEVILAVMERGVAITTDYLHRTMSRHDAPVDQLTAWITGSLAQVGDPRRTARSRAVLSQFSVYPDDQVTAPMRELLIAPLTELQRADPVRDATAMYTTIAGAIRRHATAGSQPDPDELAHLCAFCLGAIGVLR